MGKPPAATGVGIIGCGNIFDRYIAGMGRFATLRVRSCADIDQERAAEAAARAGVEYTSVEQLLADPTVEVAVVLTPPATHAAVVAQALQAGKHVYVEKPVAATLADAERTVELASASRLHFAAAPDTFLGAACQTARDFLDSGALGEVFAASLFVTHHRVEERHPDPTFIFRPGGGPLLDLGPYYMAQLVSCLGPVVEVMGRTRIGHTQRFMTAPNRLVDVIDVEVPTHASAVATFATGAIATLMLSYDVWERSVPWIEIYGTRGQLQLPDPNRFGGELRVRRHGEEWSVIPPVLPPIAAPDTPEELWRGIGVADLAAAIDGREPRASAGFALHVLEALSAIQLSSDSGSVVHLTSTCRRPEPLSAAELNSWMLD
jgi:predicted dehydrogenase